MQKQHTFKRRKLNKAYDKIGSTVRYTWGHNSSTRGKMGYQSYKKPCFFCFLLDFVCNLLQFSALGPVVQSWVSTNPGLKFKPLF